MTPQERDIWGRDAQALLGNRVWKHIWERLEESLQNRELACDVAREPEVAADIIRCRQIIVWLKRKADSIVQDGEMAQIEIDELMKAQKVRPFNRGL